ncbi:MAG: MlaE family ABC transporter permease, partial [Parvibaculales bacterium]
MSVLATIGAFFLRFFAATGRLSAFISQTLLALISPPFYLRIIGQQMLHIGYYSLPVVALTSFFTGGALAIQIYYGGSQFNSEAIVSSIVALGMTRELGPVLGGLMVAGRVSAAIAAELGTMRVTEQIDALTTLSTNPFKYLVVPRVLAATLCMPILVLIADIIGIMGGLVVGTQSFGFNAAIYLQRTINFLSLDDITSGLIKATTFGFIIAIMGCYHG